jgi:hypothetical protein
VRTVKVLNIETPWWSERALAAGFDTETGDPITFAVPKDRGKKIQRQLDAGEPATVRVPALDVLFERGVVGSLFRI